MRREPIELARIQTRPAWRSPRHSLESGSASEPSALAAAAIDEAFAHLEPNEPRHSRVDSPRPGDARNAGAAPVAAASQHLTERDHPASQRTLVANLTAQLEALDRQREQLAHLLRGIEPIGE